MTNPLLKLKMIPVPFDRQLQRELDVVLWRLMAAFYYGNAYQEYLNLREEYSSQNNDGRLKLLIDVLLTDGFIIEHLSRDPIVTWYSPTAKGNRFIMMEGYVKQGKKVRLKKLWEIVKIVAVVIHGLLLIYLTYLAAVP